MKKGSFKKLIVIIVISIFLSLVVVNNFFFEIEVIGTYVPIDYKNNFDTIQLLSDHTYQRSIYGKNNKLILKSKGNWCIIDFQILYFEPFLVNFDDDYSKCPDSLLSDTYTYATWPSGLFLNDNSIQFCTSYYHDEYCYRKIK